MIFLALLQVTNGKVCNRAHKAQVTREKARERCQRCVYVLKLLHDVCLFFVVTIKNRQIILNKTSSRLKFRFFLISLYFCRSIHNHC